VWAALPEEEPLELDDPMPPDDGPRPVGAAWASVAGWPTPDPVVPPPVFSAPPDYSRVPPPPAALAPPAPAPAPPAPAIPEPAPPEPPAPEPTPPDPTPPEPAVPEPAVRPRGGPIHFESVPVPIPSRPVAPAGQRPRLPGPGAREADAVPDLEQEDPEAGGPIEDDWDDEDEEPGRRRWPWVLAALLLLLAGVAGLVLTGRVRPEAYGLPPLPAWADPARLGLPAVALPRKAPPPLALEANVVRRELPGGRQVWEVSGNVVNPTERRLPVPVVELQLVDAGGQALGRWTVRPELDNLAPGGVARFQTSAVDPPKGTVKVRVQLKPAELGRL
jgi:hypothetical protein